jgi:hypothetical protein
MSVPPKQRLWGADDVIVGHVGRYEREDLERVVRNAGFDIEGLICYGLPWLNGIRYVREKLAAKALRRGQSGDRLERTKRSGLNPDALTLPRLECFFGRRLIAFHLNELLVQQYGSIRGLFVFRAETPVEVTS